MFQAVGICKKYFCYLELLGPSHHLSFIFVFYYLGFKKIFLNYHLYNMLYSNPLLFNI